MCCGEEPVPVRIVRAAAGGSGRSASAHLRGGERGLGADTSHRRQQLLQRPAVEPTVFVLKTGHVLLEREFRILLSRTLSSSRMLHLDSWKDSEKFGLSKD